MPSCHGAGEQTVEEEAKNNFCLASLMLASTSVSAAALPSHAPQCAICSAPPIYVCPRCSTRTCSLPCSKSHKERDVCSGIRDKAAYVPLNAYGYAQLMSDYTFLEDMGRKTGDWGREIGRFEGGYSTAKGGMRGGMRGRGRGHGRAGDGRTRTKRDVLKMQLELRDIDMELLPPGMERRKLNQSTWDFKYVFKPPT